MSEVIGQFYFQLGRYRTGRCGCDHSSEVKISTIDCGDEIFIYYIKISTSQYSYTGNSECSTILECRSIGKINTSASRWQCSDVVKSITCQISAIFQCRCIGLVGSIIKPVFQI